MKKLALLLLLVPLFIGCDEEKEESTKPNKPVETKQQKEDIWTRKANPSDSGGGVIIAPGIFPGL